MKKTTMTTYQITFTNGRRHETCDTYAEALAWVRSEYPDGVVGHDGDLEGFGDRTLFWASEQESENDDGARAAGSICKLEDETDEADDSDGYKEA